MRYSVVVLRRFISDSRVSTGDAACSSCFRFFCLCCCRPLTAPGMCGTLSSSEELLTSAGRGIGGCGAAARFELFALGGRFDLFWWMIGRKNTDAADRVRMLAEAVRRGHGASTDWLYPQHPQHTWNMKSLSKLGCGSRRIGNGNPQTQYGYSTHTVRIPRGSRRIEHPPRYAASVRRCERILKTARSLYAIKIIWAHGLDGNELRDVPWATVVAQLLYAIPAWWEFLKADEKNPVFRLWSKRLNSIQNPAWVETGVRRNAFLLIQVGLQPRPCPLPTLTTIQRLRPQLRQRAHNLTLPSDVSSTAKRNFIPRMLFTDMYWSVLPCVCFAYFMYYFCYAVTQLRLSFVQ